MRPSILRLAAVLLAAPMALGAQVTGDAPYGKPAAIIDLGTSDGAALVQAQWRYSDAGFVEVDHHEPGPDLRASGAPNRTHDITPHAGTSCGIASRRKSTRRSPAPSSPASSKSTPRTSSASKAPESASACF